MSKRTILVVDDESDILELFRHVLKKEGYEVNCVPSGEEALSNARRDNPDIILLNLVRSRIDGFDVCRRLKIYPSTRHIPVVLVAAEDDDEGIVTGLELGADYYVTAPFSSRCLLTILKVVLRRRKCEAPDNSSGVGPNGLTIDMRRHEVLVQKQPISLTNTEFGILHLLARRPGWVYSRGQIVSAVKGDDYPVTDRSVDVQIVSLRKKLGKMGDSIETVRGVGYRFKDCNMRVDHDFRAGLPYSELTIK